MNKKESTKSLKRFLLIAALVIIANAAVIAASF